jgi:hypothetical protein
MPQACLRHALRVRYINWDHPRNSEFVVIAQFRVDSGRTASHASGAGKPRERAETGQEMQAGVRPAVSRTELPG